MNELNELELIDRMNITLKSKVLADFETVYSHFDAELFKYLLPPGAKLISFGGSKMGDVVHLELPLVGEWISEITEEVTAEKRNYFVDEGRKLPFPLKYWRHRHILHKSGEQTIIEDNMTYSTGNVFINLLLYPVLFLAFLPRIWQYKSYFRKYS